MINILLSILAHIYYLRHPAVIQTDLEAELAAMLSNQIATKIDKEILNKLLGEIKKQDDK